MRTLALAAMALVIAATGCNSKKLRLGYCNTSSDCSDGGVCDNGQGGSWKCEWQPKTDGPLSDASDARDARDGDGDGGEAGDASDAGDPDVPFFCRSTPHCADAGMPGVCYPDAGTCVECLTDSDCTVTTKPICDTAAHTCGGCTSDSQCAVKAPNPGICMSQDGRCASDGETIYVKNSAGCSMTAGGGGTKEVPYCISQMGIDAVTPGRRLVVMRGPDALRFWNASPTGDPVTVVGQSGATIAPGADVGIRISSGNVYIRGLRIANGSSTGVIAQSGAFVVIDRCTVENNAGGGILLDSVNFTVVNTIVRGNGPGTAGAITWGGILVNTPLAAGPKLFQRVTVQDNNAVGVTCSAQVNGNDVLASGNLTGNINTTCGFMSCTAASTTCGAQP